MASSKTRIRATTLLHFQLHQINAESLRKLSSEGFLYPSGLPSLPFFLPNGEISMHVGIQVQVDPCSVEYDFPGSIVTAHV
ncbi:hypothetical protein Pfo_012237 [Paulownia fortunei]|nr:hypothetical protein Pfo_012237 [Paulownia fortunei]